MNQKKEQILNLLANGKINDAIRLMLNNMEVLEEDVKYQIITISSWFKRLVKKESIGIEVHENEYQRIVKSIIEIVDQVTSNLSIDEQDRAVILFDRKISIKLLPILNLQEKINSFKIPLKKSNPTNLINLKLLLPIRKINVDFVCPMNIEINFLREFILSHFQLINYVEYNSILELKYLLTINNLIVSNDKLLSELDVNHGDFIGIKILMEMKKDNDFPFGGGGIFIDLIDMI